MATEATALEPKKSLIVAMANRYQLEPAKFLNVLQKTIFPNGAQPSQEQIAAFLVVANEYQLNPFIKEIYAFPARSGGGIVPIVSVDGWLTIINRQPNLDGVTYEDHINEGVLEAITCRIYRKDRKYPNEITEYMRECKRDTDTWRRWPARMLRHKALIQCARQAFGLAGIYDPDEAERRAESDGAVVHAVAEKTKENQADLRKRLTDSVPVEVEPVEAPAIDPPKFDGSTEGDGQESGDVSMTFESSGGQITVDGEVLEVEPDETSPVPPHADLYAAVKDKYGELKSTRKKAANEFLGSKMLKDLTVEEMQAFLDKEF